MKATGIVRRIDELGRIVIPKEIRRSLHIHESDALEIFTDGDGEIVLKKYSAIGALPDDLAQNCVDVLQEQLGFMCCICDRDIVLHVSRGTGRSLLRKPISIEMEGFFNKRTPKFIAGRGLPIIHGDNIESYKGQIVYPIEADCNICGLLILIQGPNLRDIIPEDMVTVQGITKILGRAIKF